MKKNYILAHDTGTGGDKAVLTDLQGRVMASAYLPYPVLYPKNEWAEQDPDELWKAVAQTTRQVLQKAGIDPHEILGVGISAQMWNTLPVDSEGKPLMNMMSWLDLRSVKQADPLMQGEMSHILFENTGNIPTAKDGVSKILWLRDERPDIWKRTAYLFDCKEYILLKLTGKIVTDWHGASAYFLFDLKQKTWSKAVCDLLGIPIEMLPPAYPCTDVIGEVTAEASALTGLAVGTPVVNCAGDVGVAQSGSGANRSGKAHLCIGTATWVGLSIDQFINHPERPFWGLNHIDPQKYIIAGEMETGGGALMWFRDTFCQEEIKTAEEKGLSAYELISQMADSVPPGADKLLFLPWLSGERAPVLDHYARGGFIGMNLSHNRNHMARAVMEGVAFHIRWICEELHLLGVTFDEMNAIGGGSSSPVWTQIIADITGKTLRIVKHPLEAGAMGAALTVAVGLGVYSSMDAVDDLIAIKQLVHPQERNRPRYDAMYTEYRQVYQAMAPIFRRLYHRA